MAQTLTQLKGLTWGHTRGLLPLLATSLRFSEMYPEVQIDWQVRHLQAFADQKVTDLAEKFDLLVIDHPSVGEAAAEKIFLPLDSYLPAEFLADQKAKSVGASHDSYNYNGHQWALAIDAAAPVAAWRAELFEKHKGNVPQTWEELIEFAKAGWVAFAGLPLDCLMHWYSFCIAEGHEPFTQDAEKGIVVEEVGIAALEALLVLSDLCGKGAILRNPIQNYELLSSTSMHCYSPLGYGYSNYARRGYGLNILTFGEPPKYKGKTLKTTLGGAGLALSARLLRAPERLKEAVSYAEFVASPVVQCGIYTAAGGQPGHRSAWEDVENNVSAGNYFNHTLPIIDRAFIRPRHAKAIAFQSAATAVMGRFLRHEINSKTILSELNSLHIHFQKEAYGAFA